ncbi:hypothetical protein [Segniliparus rugosus]|uniref:Uncharacterized protein n=1 Tax=Segniliparus rugosus (strain ATCC BAA-974 / DSM 45345 / CCUG 50838 / CIP 108380 / JCM 13579 / CDC 945) TaxID=679197 RepID=E5XV53_SEGRC|nr:hypothetical protein [Segniliparus rugosus]EFV11758.1 hypothetical protein HMPREF9336_03375 [Segniliparus rugosus ATCC BAA-974]
MRTFLIAAVAAAGLASALPAAVSSAEPDGITSADVTRGVPAAHRGARDWATYTVTVRPNSAELVVRNGAGDDVSHSMVPLRDDGGLPVLEALSKAGGSCRGGDHLVVWQGGTVVADRSTCSGALKAALAPVDEAFGLPGLFDQMAGQPEWPADPNGYPLQPGRQPYI